MVDFNDIHTHDNAFDGLKFECFYNELRKAIVDNIDLKIINVGCYVYTRVHDIDVRLENQSSIILRYTRNDKQLHPYDDLVVPSSDEMIIMRDGSTIRCSFVDFSKNDINILEASIINKITMKYYGIMPIENANVDFIQTMDFGNVPESILQSFWYSLEINEYTPKVLKSKYNLIHLSDIPCAGLKLVRKLETFGIRYLVMYLSPHTKKYIGKQDDKDITFFYDDDGHVVFEPCFYNAINDKAPNYFEFMSEYTNNITNNKWILGL